MLEYLFKTIFNFIMDILETIAFVGSIYMILHFFVITPHKVQGQSMMPNFYNGDYIMTSKITLKLRPLHRGDVIVFKKQSFAGAFPEGKLLIKRIVGLPGDKIKIEDGKVYVNDQVFPDNYTSDKTEVPVNSNFMNEGEEIVVPENYFFVLGDNRPHSEDSRVFGPVSFNDIEGVVFLRYFPPQRFGFIKNPIPKNLWTLNNLSFNLANNFY